MQVYESGEKFVLGVQGGEFREFESGRKAIILNNRPIPTKLWTTPVEELRSKGGIAEFHWDASNLAWIEMERGFKYEGEDEEEKEEKENF